MMISEVRKPQNIVLNSKFFPALAYCDHFVDFFFAFTESLDVLEEVVKLRGVRCQGEIEILVRILRNFEEFCRDAEENQDQKARILSFVQLDKMSYSDLNTAIEKCDELLSETDSESDDVLSETERESAVVEFRATCAKRLHDGDYEFERSSPILPLGNQAKRQ